MKTKKLFFCICLISIITGQSSSAQQPNIISKWMTEIKSSPAEDKFQPYKIFDDAQKEKVIDAQFGELTRILLLPDALNSIISDNAPTIELEIPTPGNGTIFLELAQVNILTGDFNVGEKNNSGNHQINFETGIFYRGIVKGNENSTASISLFQNEMMGLFTTDEGTFTIGKMDDESESYVIYNSTLSAHSPVMNCFTDDKGASVSLSEVERGVGCKEISVYFECDYKLYTDNGSNVTNVVNYVTGLFNEVATLYANENIVVVIQSIYVWTVSDPYTSYSTASAVLSPFSSNNSPFTTANLAHFLSTRSLGGGVAYLNSLCSQYSCFAVSGIYTSYSAVPAYSWSVEVISHEMGHNIGSPHTHNCSWAGGPIDNCGPTAGYPTEGGCADGPVPVGGGTIMSYCHLVGGVGINFNNGFGALPGDLLRNKTIAANCVNATGPFPVGLSVSGLSASTAILNWNAVAGVLTYTIEYKTAAATSWTAAGTTALTSMQIYNLVVSTAYNWHVKTDCSNFSASGNFTTSNYNCPKPTNLTTTNITATSAQLNWTLVSAATSYFLQYRLSVNAAWIDAGYTTNNYFVLNGLFNSVTYKWRVKSNCSNYTAIATFSTPFTACVKPTGLTNQYISGTAAYLTWTAVAGAAYYQVYYRVTGATTFNLWGTTFYNSAYITGLTVSSSYDWKVKANCSPLSAKKVFVTTADTGQGGGTGLPASDDFTISPNPSSDFIFIKSKTNDEGKVLIEISDLLGRKIISAETTNRELLSTNFRMNISSLSAGIYFVALRDENGMVQVKNMIKE